MKINSLFERKYTCWSEIEKEIESIEIKKIEGDAFEQFAYAYFTYFKDLYQAAEIYMGRDIPAKYKASLKLEARDSGVDGLIVREDGSTVAYQVKFRKNHEAPSYDDLTSFWAESEHATERCVFANCYNLPQQAYKKKGQFNILRDSLETLSDDFFDWLVKFAKTGDNSRNVVKHSPRDHQKKMIKEVVDGFASYDRGKLLAACGTGKTLTALWIKEELGCKSVLFVAPNLALIKQTLESWMPQAKNPFNYLCVCSDLTVATNEYNDGYDEDNTFSGVPVTTDAARVCEFINFATPKDKVIFSTYQSLDVVMLAMQQCPSFVFDIAFFDEAHRTAGNKNSEMFVLGMHDDFIPCKKRLFMTATERFVNPHIVGRAKQFDYDVFTMDNEEQYGPTFTTLSFRDAIEQGIISDYKIVLCCMNESELRHIIQENQVINLGDRRVDAQTLFKQVLLAKTMDDIRINKVISYHRNIRSAELFINPEDGAPIVEVIANIMGDLALSDVYAGHINGTMSAGNRKKIFDTFIAAPFGVISNARCLTEGVDVPIIDAVYFAEPKNSIIDIIQAVGRSLRIDKNKPNKVSYIIVPVIISDVVAKFEDIDPKEFSTLHSVIQALRDQDRILADYIDKLNLRAAKGKSTHHLDPDVPILVELSNDIGIDDFADNVSLRIAEVNKDSRTLVQEFRLKAGSRTSGVKRTFRTVGDYNIEAYYLQLVLPTLKLYPNSSLGLPREQITIDHNNVSHCVKIGALIERDLKFYITDIGKALLEYPELYKDIFKEQMLKYYELDAITRIPKFPYRTAFRVLQEINEISRLEFAYSLYIVKNFGEQGVREVLSRIKYIRDTYPNIEILNTVNKKIVLEVLNAKYDTTLSYEDIWTSRTTVYNQFNYIKKHFFVWDQLFDLGAPNDVIRLLPDGGKKIQELLEKSSEIESCPLDQIKRIFISYRGY